jgi:thiol:disulfide interchange protein DsbD
MKLLSTARTLAGVCALFLLAPPMHAADPVPVHWKATATAASVPLAKGAKVRVRIAATIMPGWHLYAFDQQPGGPLPTNVSLASGQPFVSDGAPGESDPKTEFDANFNLPTSIFEGSAVFTIPARASAPITARVAKVQVDVAFQTCNDRFCLPLTVVHLVAPIQVRKAHP